LIKSLLLMRPLLLLRVVSYAASTFLRRRE